MIVMKFGGTSVGSAERIKKTAQIIKSRLGRKPVVVVSAVTKVTDMLVELARGGSRSELIARVRKVHHDVLEGLGLETNLVESDLAELEKAAKGLGKSADAKTQDLIQSFGERMSSKIVAAHLNDIGIAAKAFNSYEIGMITDDNFGKAEPLEIAYKKLNESIKKQDVLMVITGFLGRTKEGDITTLGRGGSDYSASIVGLAISAEEIQIWTDVNGIMTADPRVVTDAKTIREVSFAEASELAYFGAKVLHPKTIGPAIRRGIPVKVLNSFEPENPGTTIVERAKTNKHTIKSLAYKKNITLINVQSIRILGAIGFLAKLFGIFEKYGKSIDMIATSEVSVSMTVDDDSNLDAIIGELKNIANVSISRNKSIICVVGEGMRNTPGISGKTFSTLGRENINIEMVSQGASEINITFIVDGKDAEKAIRALHREFFG